VTSCFLRSAYQPNTTSLHLVKMVIDEHLEVAYRGDVDDSTSDDLEPNIVFRDVCTYLFLRVTPVGTCS
jgi:hypothetical protein